MMSEIMQLIVTHVSQQVFNALEPRLQRLEDRYQQLGGATDERIDDQITAFIDENDHFIERVRVIVDSWADMNETPEYRIKRAVRDMIDNGDIVVNIDTV